MLKNIHDSIANELINIYKKEKEIPLVSEIGYAKGGKETANLINRIKKEMEQEDS